MSTFDLAVAYRIYPKISKIPAVFPHDKLKMSEVALRSFKAACGNLRVRVHALLDGCPEEYAGLFERMFDPQSLVIHRYPGVGNLATFRKQIEILSGQNEADAVYFAEDDYFYLPGALEEMLAFMKASGPGESTRADFVTPYDHPDYYAHPLHDHPVKIRWQGQRHWRQAASTCLTFLTSRSVLLESRGRLETYSQGNPDASVWLKLTRQGLFDVPALTRSLLRDYDTFALRARAWRHLPAHNLFGKRWNLWVPIPTLSTHLESTGLAPGIDWKPLLEQAARAV